jgi:hypothetical protein
MEKRDARFLQRKVRAHSYVISTRKCRNMRAAHRYAFMMDER